MDESRRDALKKLVRGVVGGAAALAVMRGVSAEARATPKRDNVDPLSRMEWELQESLRRPDHKWVMVIDLRKCVGCHSCTVACVAENRLPPGILYRPVADEEIGKYPNVRRKFLPRPCMHCENPPCVAACPVKAISKSKDNIVEIDYNRCVGARECIKACPYGAIGFDLGQPGYLKGFPASYGLIVGQEGVDKYEDKPNYEYSQKWVRKDEKPPIYRARKCHFCRHRIEMGMLPACVTTCIGRATYFGNKNDPGSLVSELIARPNVMRLKEELGTEPQCYYLT